MGRVLRFPSTAGLKPFQQYFCQESISHPAKANLWLLRYLIQHYTKQGEVILDPMAGTGSTGVMAALLNRDSILIDSEEKVYEVMKKNAQKVRIKKPDAGKISVFNGDSRKLTEILKEVGFQPTTIVTSPPYKTANEGGGLNKNLPKTFRGVLRKHSFKISDSPLNIDNLPYTEIDSIITSPPYAESLKAPKSDKDLEKYRQKLAHLPSGNYSTPGRFLHIVSHEKGYSKSEANIGNLPLSHGAIDTILTSPPYSDVRKKKRISQHDLERKIQILEAGAREGRYRSGGKNYRTPGRLRWLKGNLGDTYLENEQNIGNLSHGKIDFIITSPPYEASLEGTSRHTKGGIASRDPKLAQTGTFATTLSFGVPVGYSSSKDNIGNLKGETYLEAMYKVYKECYKVLKPNGKMMLILKRFIRKGRAIPLEEHTQRICEHIGFRLVDKLLFKLPKKSFWRLIYQKKYSDKCGVEDMVSLEYEVILVFEKPETGNPPHRSIDTAITNLPY